MRMWYGFCCRDVLLPRGAPFVMGETCVKEEVKKMGYLISETTKEEREKIVADSLGNIEANCDGCMSGLAEMYQDYIDGKKELREINMEFNARYIKGDDMPGRKSCMEY